MSKQCLNQMADQTSAGLWVAGCRMSVALTAVGFTSSKESSGHGASVADVTGLKKAPRNNYYGAYNAMTRFVAFDVILTILGNSYSMFWPLLNINI